MQWCFIMYHYYRSWSVYNWIRVFVSSYVWMTGFGNFLYFDKTKDFSFERVVSMVIRINYFPILLSLVMGVSLDLYYVVPLHTEGFFMTMITCYLGYIIEKKHSMSYYPARVVALFLSLLFHILFYETDFVLSLLTLSDEIHFRFQADKYSAWCGLLCGLFKKKADQYMSWAYGDKISQHSIDKTIISTSAICKGRRRLRIITWTQRMLGFFLIISWYFTYGKIHDKHVYNSVHPYIFIFPLLGWLMIRNSSRWLTESHSTFLEFLGRNTLETYVLQFHLFMNHNVENIPVIIPGSDASGNNHIKFLNMIICGILFVTFAVWTRNITITTQNTIVALVKLWK